MTERVFVNKGDFIESIDENSPEYSNGLIKFNIPDYEERHTATNGEGVWGWCEPDDKAKYEDDHYEGTIKAILLNSPINYIGIIKWGDELQLKCHGNVRPTLDPDWLDSKLREMGIVVEE